jgi:putative ABC transport system substrate-binding protein
MLIAMNRRRALALAVMLPSACFPARSASRQFRIGVLDPDPTESSGWWKEFVSELERRGYREGRELVFERRFGEEQNGAGVYKFAAELVALKVDLIYAAHGSLSALAAKNATKTIPIVFFSSADPVRLGLVKTLSRPGGNVTGSSISSFETIGKSLEFLKQAIPGLRRVVELTPTGSRALPWFDPWHAAAGSAAQQLGFSYELADVNSMAEVETVIRQAAREGVDAITVGGGFSGFLHAKRRDVAALLISHKIASVGDPTVGFLLQYEVDYMQLARKAAAYVDKILKGAKPADLPVEQPSAFEFVVNETTARRIGLRLPKALLLQAKKVVQ